ncbi:MAG: hypothetical protein NTY57_03820 [Solirubrobacterales bacterium]|nr:hypothetical protein [Solirubrobacterales bacterium]
MSRPARIALIFAGVVAFIVISLGVGRMLGARDSERVLVEQIIRAQAKGDTAALIKDLPDCGAGTKCNKQITALVKRVQGPTLTLETLQITRGAGFGAGGATGVARIAWHLGKRLPVVQCLGIKRTGNVISGFAIHLTSVSNPIAREGACPGVANLLV